MAETTEEPPEEAPPPEVPPPEVTTAATPPPPRTYKERIVANLKEANRGGDEALVETAEDGCKNVTFNYATPFVGSTIPSEPSTYFEAVYGDEALRGRTCNVKTNAYGDFTDSYGNTTQEVVFTASMDRATADKINWSDTWNVNFKSLQTVEYMHPEVEANIAEEKAREAVDCMQDEGLFDFDSTC